MTITERLAVYAEIAADLRATGERGSEVAALLVEQLADESASRYPIATPPVPDAGAERTHAVLMTTNQENDGWVCGLKWVSSTEALVLEAAGKASRTGRRDNQGRVLMQKR